MNKISENLTAISPKNQLYLFGYEYYFNSFIKLYQKNKLPNVIFLSGPNGSGKATFASHFINYLLSQKDDHSEIKHLSLSSTSINVYHECPLKYKYTYVDHIPGTTEKPYLKLGKIIHKVLELFH